MATPLDLTALDAYWRAANYLTVGQIYLQANPLLETPLLAEHVKARLLGHWGTSPGLNLLYAHLNRLILEHDLESLLLVGPGHGGPAILANLWLEGTYSQVYPHVARTRAGMLELFRQFSTPGGVPSHVGPATPGSIHEGGELGYVLMHAFGAVMDNPNLVAFAVVGDGEAETCPLEGSWKGISFLDPAHDGAVLPILHLNGYKISGPTLLGRATNDELRSLFRGHGYDVHIVSGADPAHVHRALADALDTCIAQIRNIRTQARAADHASPRPRWPLLVLRTPKGWTGPAIVDGVQIEGTHRSHQVPLANVRQDADHRLLLERWMQSYRPNELFSAEGVPARLLDSVIPRPGLRLGGSGHANGAYLRELDVPAPEDYALEVATPGTRVAESTRQLGAMLRDTYVRNPVSFRLFCPDEVNSNRLGAVFETERRCLVATEYAADDRVSRHGRVMEVLSEHNCQGWLEGYLLTGRHGMLATYEAFAMIVASMATQHAKWLETCAETPFRAHVPSLNYLLTSTCWRNDHNGFSHQGPGFLDTLLSKKGTVTRAYFPPDANCLLHVAQRCLASYNHINLIVIDKQPQLQWLSVDAAREHCRRGAAVWSWASSHLDTPADVILACAGDVPTLETLAAASWLRENAPSLAVRVVNVVDLMTLAAPAAHPHGMSDERFEELFGTDTPVVFAFHGYAGAIHQLVHGRPNSARFHVRGFQEEGSTTTPFDMVVRNRMSRYHLVALALERSNTRPPRHELLVRACQDKLAEHAQAIRATFEDLPEVRDWRWPW